MKRKSDNLVTPRNPLIYGAAVVLSKWGVRHLSNTYSEISPLMYEYQRQGYRFLFVGLHKSLWETTGVQTILYLNQLPVPYAAMGDNLIHGRFYQEMAKRSGLFLVKRAIGRKGLLESAASLKDALKKHLTAEIDVIIYPEGTRKNIPQFGRYGAFFTTVFEASLDLANSGMKLALVPVNVDYSHIREDLEMLRPEEKNPRTLHFKDSLKMLSHLGDIYVNIGEPVIPDPLKWNRKTLAAHVHQACLNLVKILPVNIVSWAILNLKKQSIFDSDTLFKEIERIAHILTPHQDRFRGFSLQHSGEEIFKMVAQKRKEFRDWATNRSPEENFFNLYRNYISHIYQETSDHF